MLVGILVWLGQSKGTDKIEGEEEEGEDAAPLCATKVAGQKSAKGARWVGGRRYATRQRKQRRNRAMAAVKRRHPSKQSRCGWRGHREIAPRRPGRKKKKENRTSEWRPLDGACDGCRVHRQLGSNSNLPKKVRVRRHVEGTVGHMPAQQREGGKAWWVMLAMAILFVMAGDATCGGYLGMRLGEASNPGPYSEGGAAGSKEAGGSIVGGEEHGMSDSACAQMLNDILGYDSGWVDPYEHEREWRRYQENATGVDAVQEGRAGGSAEGAAAVDVVTARREAIWERDGGSQCDEYWQLESYLRDYEQLGEQVDYPPMDPEWEPPPADQEERWTIPVRVGEKSEAQVAEYSPCRKFDGPRQGMVFKSGEHGIGYYRDIASTEVETRTKAKGTRLYLDELIHAGDANMANCEVIDSGMVVEEGKRARGRRRFRKRPSRRKFHGMDQALAGADGSEESVGGGSHSVEGAKGDPQVAESSDASDTGSDDSWGGIHMPAESDGSTTSTMTDSEHWGSENSSSGEELSSRGGSGGSVDDGGSEDSELCDDEHQESAGKDRSCWLVDTINANAWGRSSEGGTGAIDFLKRSVADIVGIQETRLASAHRCGDGIAQARRAKWKVRMGKAGTTQHGYPTAGVAVAYRSHFGAAGGGGHDGVAHDTSRIVSTHVGAVCRGGIHIFSVYLFTKEGMTERNRGLLAQLARMVTAVRGPWIIMGDWNLPPAALEETAWTEEIQGKIMCTSIPTCNQAVLDYFVVDKRLMPSILYIKRLEGFGTSPHYPVRLAIRAEPRQLMVRALVAPTGVRAILPLGCLGKEHAEGKVEGTDWMKGPLEDRLRNWYSAAEEVWAGIKGLEGEAYERAMGRCRGPRLVWKSGLGPPGDTQQFSTLVSRSWKRIQGWVKAMARARSDSRPLQNGNHPMAQCAGVARRRIRAAWKWQWRDGEQKARLHEFLAAWEEADASGGEGKLLAMEAWAKVEADKACSKAAREEARRYREWLNSGPANGLSRQHRASKCAGQWIPAKMVKVKCEDEYGVNQVDEREGEQMEARELERVRRAAQCFSHPAEAPANIQQEVDAEGERWSMEWAEGAHEEKWQWPDLGPCLQPISVQDLKDAAGTFPDQCGLGWDRIHPKALKRLPHALLEGLCDLLMTAEKEGEWSEAVGVVITALIPKAGGGWRPIGLLPMVIRLWAKIRGRMAEEWEEGQEREYLYGGKGRGAQLAGWQFSANAEAAWHESAVHAAGLLDIEKAYERIPHHVLVREAHARGYPLALLRLSLAGYRIARIVGVGGIFSRPILPMRGIVAGSGFATRELRALVIGVFDKVMTACPWTRLTVYVDDATLACTGTERTVIKGLIEAIERTCSGLTELGFTMSKSKNVVLASNSKVGKEVEKGLEHWGVKFVRTARMLGADSGGGVRRSTVAASQRIKGLLRRMGQFGKLRKAGVDTARLLRTGALASAQFAQACLGIGDFALLQLRRAAAGIIGGSTAGKRPGMVLAAADAKLGHRADPAFAAHAEPIGSWAAAVWDNLMPRQRMGNSVVAAKRVLTCVKRPWAAVKGPAGALVASAARLGWTVVDAGTIITDVGEELLLHRDSPAMVKKKVHAAVVRWRWEKEGVGRKRHNGRGWEGPIWEPVAALIAKGQWRSENGRRWPRTETILTKGERAALRSVITGGQWPQTRLFMAGLAEYPWCELCLREGQHNVGNCVHRAYECAQVERYASTRRHAAVEQWWRREGKEECEGAQGEGNRMKWERALMPASADPPPPPGETFQWVTEPKTLVTGATVYMDGSVFDGPGIDFAVCGWAFVIVKNGEVAGIARGTPPDYVRTIPAAEAWALAMAVGEVEFSSAKFFTDCQSVKNIARKGARRATDGSQLNARIWNVTFGRTDGDSPLVEWIPSHLTEQAVGQQAIGDGSLFTHEQWRMNQIADQHAKAAACSVRHAKEGVEKRKIEQMKVATIADWLGRATFAANNGQGEGIRDTTAVRKDREGGYKQEKQKKEATEVTVRPVQLGGHMLEEENGEWRCSTCWKRSRRWERIARGRCSEAAARMWAKRAMVLGGQGGTDGAGHRRAAYGKLTWCTLCGAYAEKWAVGLAAPCRGQPKAPSQVRVLNRLRRARHPRTNAVLEDTLVVEAPRNEGAGHAEGSEEDEEGQLVGGLRKAKRGRSTAGYIRLPGGDKGVDLVGERQVEEEVPEGPRAKLLRRNKVMALSSSDLALQGAERARREQEAWEAREEGWRIEADLVALMGKAMEASQATQQEPTAVGAREGSGDTGSEEAEGPTPTGGRPPLSRKELVRSLQQLATQQGEHTVVHRVQSGDAGEEEAEVPSPTGGRPPLSRKELVRSLQQQCRHTAEEANSKRLRSV